MPREYIVTICSSILTFVRCSYKPEPCRPLETKNSPIRCASSNSERTRSRTRGQKSPAGANQRGFNEHEKPGRSQVSNWRELFARPDHEIFLCLTTSERRRHPLRLEALTCPSLTRLRFTILCGTLHAGAGRRCGRELQIGGGEADMSVIRRRSALSSFCRTSISSRGLSMKSLEFPRCPQTSDFAVCDRRKLLFAGPFHIHS